MLRRFFAVPALLIGLTIAGTGAPAAQQQDSAARAWISPTRGPTLTVIQLFAEGLPGLSEVIILAGSEPNQLRPILRGDTDARGNLAVQFKVPEEAERGQPFYFALDPAGDAAPVMVEPPFEVIVRENVAPGGA